MRDLWDKPWFSVLTKLTYSAYLNILWLICSLPIFTIGASTTALFYCTLKMAEDRDEGLTRMFFRAFRSNFKPAAQQMGIGTTSTAKAGFMTALYVVLVPVFGVLFGRRPSVKLWCCVAASVVGLYLLCLAGHDSLALTGGEWQLLGCAFLFATQILLVDHFSPKLDGIQLSFVQFLTVAVISTVFMLIFEQPTIEQFRLAAVAIAYCGIMSSGVAYTLQIVGQKALDPTIASLAMCLESVFSALAGWLILGETLSTTELCGCGLMFAAIVASQLPDKKKV